jgi:archaellum component FlaF (FlaF/FlaG flagellin family)
VKNKISTIILLAILISVAVLFAMVQKERNRVALNNQVQSMIQNTFNDKSRFGTLNFKAENVFLVRTVGNKYEGTVEVFSNNRSEKFKINVVKEGGNLMYEFESPADLQSFAVDSLSIQ